MVIPLVSDIKRKIHLANHQTFVTEELYFCILSRCVGRCIASSHKYWLHANSLYVTFKNFILRSILNINFSISKTFRIFSMTQGAATK